MKSEVNMLRRETSSRKSGHTCTICGAVFGLWARLADHKQEVHCNSHKSISRSHTKAVKNRILDDMIVFNNAKNAKSGKNQGVKYLNWRLKHDAVSDLINEYKVDCKQQSVRNCGLLCSNIRQNVMQVQKEELVSDFSAESSGVSPEQKQRKGKGDSKTLLMFPSCQQEVIPEKTKKNTYSKEKSITLEMEKCKNTDIKKMNESTEKDHVNKNIKRNRCDVFVECNDKMDNKEAVLVEPDIKNLARKELKNTTQAFAENSTETEEKDFPAYIIEELPCGTDDVILDKHCSETAFLTNGEELLDVEEEIVCTGDNAAPTYSDISSHQVATVIPVFNDMVEAAHMLALDNSKSEVIILLKDDRHCDGSTAVQVVNVRKPPARTEKISQHNSKFKKQITKNEGRGTRSCIQSSASVISLLCQNQIESGELPKNQSLSSKFILMKKTNGQSRCSSAKQMVSLLANNRNLVDVVNHLEERNSGCNGTTFEPCPVAGTEPGDCTSVINNKQRSVQKTYSCKNFSQSLLKSQSTESPLPDSNLGLNLREDAMFEKFRESVEHEKKVVESISDSSYAEVYVMNGNVGEKKQEHLAATVDTDLQNKSMAVEGQTDFQEVDHKLIGSLREKILSNSSEQEKLEDIVVSETRLTEVEKLSISSSKDSLSKPNNEELDYSVKLKGQSKLQCSLCNREFSQSSNLRKHIRVSHGSYRPHKCKTCGKSFPFLSSLKDHQLVHSDSALEKAHTCEICGKAFTRVSGLRKHSKEEHLDVKPYVCVMCQKSFSYLCSLKAHMRSHSVDRPFRCEVCGQTFKQSSNLNKHIRLHHRVKCACGKGNCSCGTQDVVSMPPGKSAMCEVCGRVCEGQKQLMIHMRVHTGEKPEVCDTCGKCFQHKSNLLKHQMKHSGTKPFVCKFCARAFYANHSLLSHMRLHTGDSPFQCGSCGKKFCTKNGLQVHALLHNNVRPFACSTCGKTFTQLGNLNKHVALHTGERPFVCVYCKKGFVDSSALKRHTVQHEGDRPFTCAICEKRFHSLSALRSHEVQHMSEQEVECRQESERHLCPICDRYFIHQQNYMRHMKRHRATSADVNEVVLSPGEYIVYLTE